jgi:elongation factor Ts
MIQQIKELRERTNISMAKCKSALEATNGNIDEAIVWLQKQGAVDSVKKAGRETNEGLIYSYIHMNKVGVMVEVSCETDFASRSEPFKTFTEQVALQIAAMDPQYISSDQVPEEEKQARLDILKEKSGKAIFGKPEVLVNKILSGQIEKWYAEICLMNQVSVVDSERIVEQLRTDLVAKIGENVVVKRFVRWELGR